MSLFSNAIVIFQDIPEIIRGVFHFRKDSETFGKKRKETEGCGHCQETKSLIMLCCQKWQRASVRYRAGAFSILFQKEAAYGNPDFH